MIRNIFMVLVVISMGCTQETLVTQSNQPSDNSAKPPVEYSINANDAPMTASHDESPPARARRYPSRPLEVSSLPQSVVAEDGALTLYADYDDIWQNHFVLYIVNKSANSVRIPKEDTDFYIKLETMTDGGEWQRAQTHEYSWCGNSYHSVDLEPNKFISTLGWKPSSGVKQKVRYRFCSSVQVASNIGTALVDPDIVLSAKNDQMSEVLAAKTDSKAVR